MADYIISERAVKDLKEIADYTEKNWSETQAERYVRMLFKEFARLADNPLADRSYDDYRTGLRGHSCGKHVILYRMLSRSKVRVVRILHSRMDFTNYS